MFVLCAISLASCMEDLKNKKPQQPRRDNQPMQVVVDRVNRNNEAMDFLLHGDIRSAEGEYVEADGTRTRLSMTGDVFFRKPRNLFLRLKHTLGAGMEVGSNYREFWVWKRMDPPQYWWGLHELMTDVADADVPVRPDHLLEVVGLAPIRSGEECINRPAMRVMPEHYELSYLSCDVIRNLYYTKSIAVDRYPPYLIRAVTYYRPDGHILMRAELSKYQQIEGSDILAAHRIRLDWQTAGSWLELTFSKWERSNNDKVEPVYVDVSPLQAGKRGLGLVTRVDTSGVRTLTPHPQPGQDRGESSP